MSEKILQLNEEIIKGGNQGTCTRQRRGRPSMNCWRLKQRKLTQAARYERNEQRQGYRSGHYSRNLTTTSGDVALKGAQAQRVFRLKLRSLKGIAAVRAVWKKRLSRCIWRVYPSGV